MWSRWKDGMSPLPGPWQRSLRWGARLGLDCNTSKVFHLCNPGPEGVSE